MRTAAAAVLAAAALLTVGVAVETHNTVGAVATVPNVYASAPKATVVPAATAHTMTPADSNVLKAARAANPTMSCAAEWNTVQNDYETVCTPHKAAAKTVTPKATAPKAHKPKAATTDTTQGDAAPAPAGYAYTCNLSNDPGMATPHNADMDTTGSYAPGVYDGLGYKCTATGWVLVNQ